ncbi:hypothetical protein OAB79_00620 [Yoonia sp.]|nr:hypothetical protein [Yoonia sp.]
MIDDPDKTQKLIAEMDAHLPLTARLSQSLKGLIRRQVAPIIPLEQCQVVEVFYMGDEGGISCRLDFDGQDTHDPIIVSITHLNFNRRFPLFRQIDGYQKHRVKKLKKQNGRGF